MTIPAHQSPPKRFPAEIRHADSKAEQALSACYRLSTQRNTARNRRRLSRWSRIQARWQRRLDVLFAQHRKPVRGAWQKRPSAAFATFVNALMKDARKQLRD